VHVHQRINENHPLNFHSHRRNLSFGKISKIELVDLSPEDAKKAAAIQDSPSGGKVCLTLKPVKKLVISIETKDSNGSSSSNSENFVAEKDGKFVIPVPGPCK
jgi:hypothetical protein